MRVFCLLAILSFFGCPVIADDMSAETALGEYLVTALATDDVVAYSQCWVSSRRLIAKMKEIGVDLPADEWERMPENHALRNKDIAESFRKIQSLIISRNIERQSIRLKACTAKQVREQKAPNGSAKLAGGFTIVLSAGTEEWRFEVDDGVIDHGMWHFSDSPINLFAGETVLRFQDHRRR